METRPTRSVDSPCFDLDSVLDKGFIFISADHRLICPSTGFDIIEDMKALMNFLADPSFSTSHLPAGLSLDSTRIGVLSISGGGYAARALALYASPKPRALYLLYGMGGDLLCDHWVTAKDDDAVFDTVSPVRRSSIAHFLDTTVTPSAESPMTIGSEWFDDDQRRTALFCYLWRTGELLDHILGEPVSATLRTLPAEARAAAVPNRLRPAMLETQLDASFPPTFLLHGDADNIVPLSESQKTYESLHSLGVEAELEVVPGGRHALVASVAPLEFCQGAKEAHENGMQFLRRHLLKDSSDPAVESRS